MTAQIDQQAVEVYLDRITQTSIQLFIAAISKMGIDWMIACGWIQCNEKNMQHVNVKQT